MKNKSIACLVAIAVVGLLSFGCSDGELTKGALEDITVVPTIKFTATPEEVEVGGSTTLSWEVINATSLEITTAPDGGFQFHGGPFTELTGSTVVDGITETTDFTLTATNEVTSGEEEETTEENKASVVGRRSSVAKAQTVVEEEEETPTDPLEVDPLLAPKNTASVTKTVYVVSRTMTADITAEKESLEAGESTIIRWTVNSGEAAATATVTSSSGEVIAAQEDCILEYRPVETPVEETPEEEPAEDTPEEISAGVEEMARVDGRIIGCATVTPAATTTYTLSAATEDGRSATDAVTIQVTETDLDANILVNGQEEATIQDFATPVNVTWTVAIPTAKVTVTASPSAQCTPELPSEVESASGEASCVISAETTFTIRAELGDKSDTDSAMAKLPSGGAAAAEITADPWVFESEETEIEVKFGTSAVNVTSMKICGNAPVTDKQLLTNGSKQTCKVPRTGVQIEVQNVGMTTPVFYNAPQTVIPVEIQYHLYNGDPLQVTSISPDPNSAQVFMHGTKRTEFGGLSVFKLGSAAEGDQPIKGYDIAIEEAIKDTHDISWKDNSFFDPREFPVNAVAVRPDNSSWIFVASNGILMYSNDGGGSWNKLITLFYKKGSNYSGKTCAGKSQAGLPAAGSSENLPEAIGQFCDIISKSDGRLIVAYDRGILTTDNVETYIDQKDKNLWTGKVGENIGLPDAPANDLQEAGGKIYVATDSGVYVNEDGLGKTWAVFGSISGSVYSLVFDEKSNKLFAGVDGGIYVTSLAAAPSWTKTEGSIEGMVLSMAVDPYHPEGKEIVIAGTSTGLYVTRDSGETWGKVDATTNMGEIRAVALSVSEVIDSKATYKLSAGGSGYMVGGGPVNVSSTAVPVQPGPTPEPGTPEPGTPEEPTVTPVEGLNLPVLGVMTATGYVKP